MTNVVIFNGHLEYFTAICYMLWPFGIFCVHLVYQSRFTKTSGNPGMYNRAASWKQEIFAPIFFKKS
jgi:hypothetical protein